MKLDEKQVVTLVEALTISQLRLWVASGWVQPSVGQKGPSFDEVDVARIRLVCELRDELDLDDDTVPMVLSLLDQIHGLRHELRALLRAVEDQPDEIRHRIARDYRANMRR